MLPPLVIRDVNETRACETETIKIGLETETSLETLTSHHKLITECTAKTKVKISK